MGVLAKIPSFLQSTIKAATPQLKIIQRYALVELVPPSPRDLPAIRSGISKLIHSAKTGSFKNLTVKEATLNTLVAIEVYCWFFIGECIGKRHIVGYDV
ncbi:ATP synthase subunit g, mitochondrial isoform X1 [Copidosoma floridanum]|uniref:ATP synthase subunit g, mitochondrial isoform X1 n=1 Tax=Copidosoma floridanum TaxID=29053 RepID=UPI0006C961C3|nr:ATP synthase subunit g, mitochondrial isoform X1 [Copidosoma floridanum]